MLRCGDVSRENKRDKTNKFTTLKATSSSFDTQDAEIE